MVGRQVGSTELVPGDVYEVSDPSLTQFPCDSLLLAGDCIVNESMLTGGSLLRSDQRYAAYIQSRRIRTCVQGTNYE